MKKTGVSPGVIQNPRNLQTLLRSILIVLAYLISFLLLDFITKQFEILPGIVTWYPPAGLTYALLLVFGVRFTPAVILAFFCSSVFIYRLPQSPFQLLLWACVVSLVYAGGAWFLRHRIHLDRQLKKLRDVAWLVGTALLVSAFLAVLSVSSSTLSSTIPRSDVLQAIFHWWIGEAVGVLTVTPFLLILVMPWLKRFAEGKPVRVSVSWSSPYSTLASIGQTTSLLIVLYWVFGLHLLGHYHPEFLIILPVIWIALTRGLKGTTAAILILNFGVVLAQVYFRFDIMRLGELELLMIVICILGLLMGAVVTERKGAEQDLRESEDRYRDLVENSQELICTHDLEGRILSSNLAGAKMLGLEMEAVLKLNIRDILAPERQADFESYITNIKNDGKSSGLMLIQKSNGERCLWEYSNTLRKEGVAAPIVRGMARDITASKRVEEALRESEKELHVLAESMPQMVWITRPDGWNIYFNQQWVDYTGLTLEESYGHGWNKPFHPDDQQLAWDAWQHATKNLAVYSLDCRLRRADGVYKWWLIRGVPVLDAEGNILKWFGTCTDIDELKQTENEIKTQLDELQRWQAATLGRENRILELKHEVNELLAETNKVPRYPSAESLGEQEL